SNLDTRCTQSRNELLRGEERGVQDVGAALVDQPAVVGERAQRPFHVGREAITAGGSPAQRVEIRLVADYASLDRGDPLSADQVGDQALHRGASAVGEMVKGRRAERRVAAALEVQRAGPVPAVERPG